MNSEVGFCRKVLQVFEDNGVSIEHMPSGIDTMSIFVNKDVFEEKEQKILADIHKAVNPDHIELESNLALIAVVGRGMKSTRGTATLIWITVGYGLAVAVLFLGWGEAAMEGITLAKLFVFAAVAIGAYVSLLIAYGIGAGSFYKNKHIKAKQRVKKYLRDLSRIEKINNKKEIN